jgi:galactokinase
VSVPDDFRRRHRERFGGREQLFASPGRVNLIGEHTDYNDGFVLPIAIDRYTFVAMTPRAGPVLEVYSEAFDEGARIELSRPFERCGGWIDYVAGVAAAVIAETGDTRGGSISIGGDLPLGAGLSSSASLELSVALALYALAGVRPGPRRIAAAGSRAEHDYVGIRSGVMDQLICALAISGSALLIDCRSLEASPVRLPQTAAIAVCDTTVKHALASSEYNERRVACEEGVRILLSHGLDIRALRDVSASQFEDVAHWLPSPIRERCRHVVYENQRTIDAAEAIGRGDLNSAGALFNASHQSLRDLYRVSSPELDAVVACAQRIPGVYGARMTGGGFGGAAIALLDPAAFGALRAELEAAYYRPSGYEPHVFLVNAVSGASAVE